MTIPVLTEDRGSVWVITLNRPERMNALDLEDRRALLEALREAESDATCRGVVLAGNGPVFCAGGDIRSMPSDDPGAARIRLDVANTIARQLVRGRTPIVAAVEGGAFGLGLSLACAADLIVAAEDSQYCASFGKVGLIADTGLSYTLPQRVGRSTARRMLLSAETLRADQSLELGLVDEVVPVGTALDRAITIATRMAAFSPVAVAATRDILSRPCQDLETLLEAETEVQVELLSRPDFTEGRDAFLGRRQPNFTGV